MTDDEAKKTMREHLATAIKTGDLPHINALLDVIDRLERRKRPLFFAAK